ncbi:hypothetical protein MBLNU230_g7215t1 [Neophaeotheca triangularis]
MGFLQILRRKAGSKKLRQAYLASDVEAKSSSSSNAKMFSCATPKGNEFEQGSMPFSSSTSSNHPHFAQINWQAPSQRKLNGSILSGIAPSDIVTLQYAQQLQAIEKYKADSSQDDFRSSLIWEDDDDDDYDNHDSGSDATPLTPKTHIARTVNEDNVLNTLHGFPYQIGTGYTTSSNTPKPATTEQKTLNTLHGFPYQIGPSTTADLKPQNPHPLTTASPETTYQTPFTFQSKPRQPRRQPRKPSQRAQPPPAARVDFMAQRLCARGFIDWFLATQCVEVWEEREGCWEGVSGLEGVEFGVSGARVAGEMFELVLEGVVRVVQGEGEVVVAFLRGLRGFV